MDRISKEKRSEIMSKIRSKGTSIEKKVEEWLSERKIEFLKHPKIRGKPDFQVGNVLIFVDGCFWHMCPIHYRKPKSNTKYWEKNIEEKNKKMMEKRQELKKIGFKIVRIWEHEIKTGSFKDKLEKKLQGVMALWK